MKKIMVAILDWLNQGEDVALATIVAELDLVPRCAGARVAIGSRKKIESVSKSLLEQGFSEEEIENVCSLIDLAIKAETSA